jgi:hypothetical protein
MVSFFAYVPNSIRKLARMGLLAFGEKRIEYLTKLGGPQTVPQVL